MTELEVFLALRCVYIDMADALSNWGRDIRETGLDPFHYLAFVREADGMDIGWLIYEGARTPESVELMQKWAVVFNSYAGAVGRHDVAGFIPVFAVPKPDTGFIDIEGNALQWPTRQTRHNYVVAEAKYRVPKQTATQGVLWES